MEYREFVGAMVYGQGLGRVVSVGSVYEKKKE